LKNGMKYTPVLTFEKIQYNRDLFSERQALYRSRGLDLLKSRESMLDKAGALKGNILDIGSGRGIMALALARAGYNFVSIDNDEEMLETTALNLAYENLLSAAKLYAMDAYSLEFGEHYFNNIFTVEAIHHMYDVSGFFSEINRVLSPGGKVVMADFNEKGMGIIDAVHGAEGREHKRSPIGQAEAEGWFERSGYRSEKYQDECHWIIIAHKKE
jgi:2-polyprenyl-3-methyl-5-hydroxy-6-metoxy-1,4-benzoquinol methylase